MLSCYAPLPIMACLRLGLDPLDAAPVEGGDRVSMGRRRWRGAFLRPAGGGRGEGDHLRGLDSTAFYRPGTGRRHPQAKPKTSTFADAQVTIVSPAQEQTFSGGEAVTASLSIEPPPKSAHQFSITWTLNGSPVGEGADLLSFTLPKL